MYAHLRETTAADRAAASAYVRRQVGMLAISITVLLLSGCANPPPSLLAGTSPADPNSPSSPVSYRSTTTSYVSRLPAIPGPWLQQNESVAPKSKANR